MVILKLIEKNLRILFRSKLTSFVVILGPILIILLAGLAFNNSAEYNIKIGTYSTEYSETANIFIENLESEFEITKFKSEEECINSIKTKGYHSCILIPEGLSMVDNDLEEIDFYIDNTRVNIASYIEQNIYRTIQNSSTALSKDLAGNLVSTIKITRDEMQKNKDKSSAEKTHIEIIKTQLGTAKNTLTNTDLNVDESAIDVTQLEKEANSAKSEYSNAVNLADDAINNYDDRVEDIKSIGIVDATLDTEVSEAESQISSLKTDYDTVKGNNSNLDNVLALTSSFSEGVQDINSKLENAKSSSTTAATKIEGAIEELDKTKDKLNAFDLSFSKVESSINSNKILDAESIAQPVDIITHQIFSGSSLNYLFPSLIILVIMFVTLIMSASQVTQERLNKANLRVSMTPLNFNKQLIATFFSIIIIVLFQIILIILTVWLVFDIDVKTSLLNASGILITAAVFFTLLGIALGNLFKTEQATLLGSATVASIFFIVSDLILPIETMPPIMMGIITKTPFVLATSLLRKTVFFGSELGSEFKILLIYVIGLFSILIAINAIIHIYRKIKTKRKYAKI